MTDFSEGFWVFGYGSLMWRPGFDYDERALAELSDHHRSFCLDSVRYRGTPERPGLVLALEPKPGAVCRGIAYRVGASQAAETLDYLRERELVTYSYREMTLPLALLDGGRRAEAICYVIDPNHEQYRKGLTLAQQAEIIARSRGPAGPNAEYLFNTLDHLREMAVDDPEMEDLGRRVRALLDGA